MNLQRTQARRAAGVTSATHLSARERELMEAWENADPEFLAECKKLRIEPDLGKQTGPINRENDYHEPFNVIAAPQPDRYFDDAPEASAACPKFSAAEAVLRVLYVLTGSENPSLRLRTDCLLAIISRTESRSQADIARKYGLTRAAVSKTMRDMRRGKHLAGLKPGYFGGRQGASEKARIRATRVHRERREKLKSWKPSSNLKKILASL